MADKIYQHLEEQQLFPEEQKGCKKGSRGTKHQLLIDKMVIKNCKRRKTNLAMAWIDYRKAYDMVPHTWIMECLALAGVAPNVMVLLSKSMSHWKTVLTAGSDVLGEVDIRRGIFQGDSLSPLLFVMCLIPLTLILRETKGRYHLGKDKGSLNHLMFMDDLKLFAKDQRELDSLVNTVNIFSKDIGMEFGLKKCGVVGMKRGKLAKCTGIVIPDGGTIKTVEKDGYKYLGILELDGILHNDMKSKLKGEYLRRLRKTLKSKLSAKNVVMAINTWAVPVMRYGAGIINWTKCELQGIDRKTRKLLTIYKMLHPRGDVDRLYLPRESGGRGLIGVEDCVRTEENSLASYIANNTDELMAPCRRENVLQASDGENVKALKEKRMAERKDKWQSKPLHGQILRQTEDIRDTASWDWMRKGELKKETEGLITAAQEQALRTNAIKANIDKQNVSPLCRMCGLKEETVSHIICECSKLAQIEYKRRHDNVARIIHWELSKLHGLPHTDKWYEHDPNKVTEANGIKLLWDFNIQTDKVIEHRRPDIVLVDYKQRQCNIIDIAVPGDARTKDKEKEKVEKYQEIKREISRLWNVKVSVTPIVIGALGIVTTNLKKHLKQVGLIVRVDLLQKAALLGTARILRKVLDM